LFNQSKNLTVLNNTFSNSVKLQFKTTKALQYNLALVDSEATDVRDEINITSFYSQNTLKAPIALLKLSLRTYTALKKAGIFTLQDLINYSKNELLQLKTIRFAHQSLLEIELCLSEFGLSLKK
jgi:DNA-directed RNA polymerase alpha subunit